MSKFRKIIAIHWNDVKGNAKWDFIKWTFWGCCMIPAALAAVLKFICYSPLWVILLAFIGTLLLLFGLLILLIWTILRATKTETELEPFKKVDTALATEAMRKQKIDQIFTKLGKQRNAENHQTLAGYYDKLQTRKIEIERMTALVYFGKYKVRFENGFKFDEETQELLTKIEDFLRLEFRKNSFEFFTEGHGVNPKEERPLHPMYMDDQKVMRDTAQRVIDRLSHYLKQIKSILESNKP